MKPLRAGLALSLLAAGYAHLETYRFRLATRAVPVHPGAPRLSILHVSDLHLTARRRRLAAFLARLPELLGLVPDLVLATGDLIDDDSGIGPAVAALAGLEARLGRFYVLGSHDYFQAHLTPGSFGKYVGVRRGPLRAPEAAVGALEAGLAAKGWVALTNSTTSVEAGGRRVRLTGVDDPYLGRARTEHITREAGDDLAIGLMHAPDVISPWVHAGYDLVLAGHTHGGQVRLPGVGALVTNCSLPAALARGLHDLSGTWLHVSPGLGTGTYTRIRFACPPEATLLRTTPRAR